MIVFKEYILIIVIHNMKLLINLNEAHFFRTVIQINENCKAEVLLI